MNNLDKILQDILKYEIEIKDLEIERTTSYEQHYYDRNPNYFKDPSTYYSNQLSYHSYEFYDNQIENKKNIVKDLKAEFCFLQLMEQYKQTKIKQEPIEL